MGDIRHFVTDLYDCGEEEDVRAPFIVTHYCYWYHLYSTFLLYKLALSLYQFALRAGLKPMETGKRLANLKDKLRYSANN